MQADRWWLEARSRVEGGWGKAKPCLLDLTVELLRATDAWPRAAHATLDQIAAVMVRVAVNHLLWCAMAFPEEEAWHMTAPAEVDTGGGEPHDITRAGGQSRWRGT